MLCVRMEMFAFEFLLTEESNTIELYRTLFVRIYTPFVTVAIAMATSRLVACVPYFDDPYVVG